MCAVKTGDLVPTILVLESLGADALKDDMKAQVRRRASLPPPPPSRTNWTRPVLPPVLSGHVSSFPKSRHPREALTLQRRREPLYVLPRAAGAGPLPGAGRGPAGRPGRSTGGVGRLLCGGAQPGPAEGGAGWGRSGVYIRSLRRSRTGRRRARKGKRTRATTTTRNPNRDRGAKGGVGH